MEIAVSAVAGELLQNLLQISTSFLFCRGRAEDLKDTVHALFPIIEEIRGSRVDVPESRRSHMDQMSRFLQEGLEITRKILESSRYSVYRKIKLARKMDKLEKDISRFTRGIIQANILAEVSHIRSNGAESFHRLEGSNHRIERSLLEIKVMFVSEQFKANSSKSEVGRWIEMAGSPTEIPYDAEEAWGSASRRERGRVSDEYPAEEAWATGGHGRETGMGGDGYAAEEASGSANCREGGKFAEGYPAEEAWATDGHGREREKGSDEYDTEEAWSVGGCGRKGVKDVEEWAGAEEDIAVVGISGLKCGLKDSSV